MKCASLASRAVSVVSAVVLAFGLMPATAFAASASEQAANGQTANGARECAQRSEEDIEAALAKMLAPGTFVEGEAVVCFLEDPVLDAAPSAQSLDEEKLLAEAEQLSAVTAEQYFEATGETATAVDAPNSALLAQSADGDEEVTVAIVRDDNMSTEELVRRLLHNPRVLSAEPNYLMRFEDVSTPGSAPAGNGTLRSQTLTLGNGATTRANNEDASTDLTAYQWFSEGAANSTPQLPDAKNPGVHVPGWNDPDKVNSSGVVVIMDSGVDFTHPDLENVMYRFSPELQAELGCGEFGYAPNREDKTDVRDGLYHGTHCAGIVAAQWNGQGVSGVANGVKICVVSLAWSLENSNYTYDAIIKAYDFAIRAAGAGVDIRAINRSMSSSPTNNADAALIQAAGEAGIVSCIASGNESTDLDKRFSDVDISQQSPYVLRVDSSKQQDDPSWFTNYGALATDVCAPGGAILSTIPSTIESEWRYFPQVDASPLYLETEFESMLPNVYLDTNGGEGLERIEFSAADIGADGDSRSLKGTAHMRLSTHVPVYIDIPVGELEDGDVQDVSIALRGDGYATRDAQLDVLLDSGEYTSFGDGEGANRSQNVLNGWSYAAFHIGDPSLVGTGFKRVTDDQGRECIRLRITANFYTQSSDIGDTADVDLYLDQIAIGRTGNQALLPYQYLNGTSMAAPCVTGCAAVVSSSIEAASAGERAAQTVRILKGAVHQADGYRGICKQDGQVDLGLLGSTSSYAPVLEGIQVANGQVTLTGAYFGQPGTFMLDGLEVQPTSWSDSSITAPWPSELASRFVSATVTKSTGATARRAFIADTLTPAPGDTTVYERDLAPLTLYPEEAYDIGIPSSIVATENGSLFAASAATNAATASSVPSLVRSDDSGASWTPVSLPQTLKRISLAAGDGKVFVLGATPANNPVFVENWHLYSLDLESGEFSLLRSYDAIEGDEITQASSLAFVGGNLFIVDCRTFTEDYIPTGPSHMRVRKFDADYIPQAEFLLEHDYPLHGFYDAPRVSTIGNSFYVSAIRGAIHQGGDDFNYGLERVDVAEDGSLSSTDLSAAFDGLDGSLKGSDICLIAYNHGVFIVGDSLDGLLPAGAKYTDTFVLRHGSSSFSPYDRTLSHAPVFTPVGVHVDGWLYAYGTSEYEETPVFGRATKVGDDHEWGETSYAWSQDSSQATASHTCAICGETESETVNTTSAVTKEPTETEPGMRTYTAEFAAPWAQTQTKGVEIPKLEPKTSNEGAKDNGASPSRGVSASTAPRTADPLMPYGAIAFVALIAAGLAVAARKQGRM